MEAKRREVRFYRLPDGRTPAQAFLGALRDLRARVLLETRIYRASRGNFGDHRSVGEGVLEMRVDHGPGYRIYYGLDGPVLVVILTAGRKDRQASDIREARTYWRAYRSSEET